MSHRYDVNGLSSLASSVRVNTIGRKTINHRWLFATLAIFVLAAIITVVGIVVVMFAIHIATTTTTTSINKFWFRMIYFMYLCMFI